MKERSVRFTDTEVRAILEGRKTQTRRVVKTSHKSNSDYPTFDVRNGKPVALQYDHNGLKAEWDLQCPHGTVGDRLWVREAWFDNGASWEGCTEKTPARCLYRADGEFHEQCPEDYMGAKWRPSIHMPRWASRITLEITGVRVERLQEITPKDAIAEGFMPTRESGLGTSEHFRKAAELVGGPYPRGLFAMTWNQINGPESWSANPWVWVIEFRRVQQ